MHNTVTPRLNKVSILGAARSGCAAAKFLGGMGVDVFISDSCPPQRLQKTLTDSGCDTFPHEAGGHSDRLLDADVIILSPGVPSDLPILKKARTAAIPVWSEIELAFRFTQGSYIAVTGSTGKSTTVSLIGSIMEAAGAIHAVAGNIGIPLIGVVAGLPPESFVVAEISSFQLENIDRFRPKIAVVLNLLKNHLDRYESEEAYYNAKKAIAANSTADDFVVLNAHDSLLVKWAQTLSQRTNVVWFGSAPLANVGADSVPADGVWCEGDVMYARKSGVTERLFDTRSMKLVGAHNRENACAAAAAAKLAGVSNEAIAAGITAFPGLEHRLEFVAEVNGIRFFNDSKSTTAESIACAVSAFGHNVRLIAGGRDKGCDFAMITNAIRQHVKAVCLIGEAAGRIQGVWNGVVPIQTAASLNEAVLTMTHGAAAGDVVLLSPGCSSFDMFKNFEHRGKAFKELVLNMRQKGGAA